jgi:hypothetical protein
MKLYSKYTNYTDTIGLATVLPPGEYTKDVLFHCYCNGDLVDKHVISIASCHHFNPNRKIILWLENNKPNKYNDILAQYEYVETRQFNIGELTSGTFLENVKFSSPSFYKYVLLYKYGGCCFDLDILFLQSFDRIFNYFENDIIVYQWEAQNYPCDAIYISLEPQSEVMKSNIMYLITVVKGCEFQDNKILYDSPMDLIVLPCSWFDGSWVANPYKLSFKDIFKTTKETYTIDNFFKGSFCYNWHENWDTPIEEHSILTFFN